MSIAEDMPPNNVDAAHWWFDRGLKVIPICPKEKHPSVKWQKWLDNLGHDAITQHWQRRPQDELGAVLDDSLMVLDADAEKSVKALYTLEQDYFCEPCLVVKTKRGEHHYFKRAAGTYAKTQSCDTKKQPEGIDVKTGRGETIGRSIVVLPPSTGKEIALDEVDTMAELSEVDQDFIDAVFRHNGKEPPRPPEPKTQSERTRSAGNGEVVEILSYIPADSGYDDWSTVMRGLSNKFGGSDEGLETLAEWSSQAPDADTFEELEYKWRSYVPDGGTTWASVCELAKQNGADLSAIAKSYNPDGTKRRTFEEMLEAARAMDGDTHPDEIEALATETLALKPIQQRTIAQACKKSTGTPLGTFKQAAMNNADTQEAPDHLHLAQGIVRAVGSENVLGAGQFVYQWNNAGLWVEQDDRSIKQQVQRIIPDQVEAVNKNLVDGVADVFKTEVYKPDHVFNVGPVDSVNCPNGELSLEGQAWLLSPHNREHYRTTQIPVEYDPFASCPRWVQFLNEVFAGDDDAEDKKRALLEMIGYSLMAHCQHEQFVILVGGGANGKSVLLAILEALLGAGNVAGVQPSQFDRSFQRAHLHNKLANIVTEVKQGEVIDDASLKGIVSGETTTVEHKFKDPFNMSPFATCWFGTNHMPHTRDFSDGLFRRALVIEFNNVFKPEHGNCDPQLKPKLMAELSGILTMALDAYAHAIANGFTLPASCERARNAWRMEADQVAQFVEDACETDAAYSAQVKPLFDAYIDWARHSGINKTLGLRNFGERLEKLGITREKRRAGMFAIGVRTKMFNDSGGYRDAAIG